MTTTVRRSTLDDDRYTQSWSSFVFHLAVQKVSKPLEDTVTGISTNNFLVKSKTHLAKNTSTRKEYDGCCLDKKKVGHVRHVYEYVKGEDEFRLETHYTQHTETRSAKKQTVRAHFVLRGRTTVFVWWCEKERTATIKNVLSSSPDERGRLTKVRSKHPVGSSVELRMRGENWRTSVECLDMWEISKQCNIKRHESLSRLHFTFLTAVLRKFLSWISSTLL